MRRVLLWMARNSWLRRRLPRLRFVRRAVRRFMPGEDFDSALSAAMRLHADGFGIVFTALGENLTSVAEAGDVATHYRAVIDRSKSAGIPAEISVKPTQLGLDLDRATTVAHLDALATAAAEAGTFLWIDMEGSAYAEPTIELYQDVRSRHENVGICLQAYLRRTAADVQRLLPLRPAIRLVKGAYDEPASIAFRSRSEVDASYLALAVVLAEAARDGRARVALGTHDVSLIERTTEFSAAAGVGKERLEVHMLYGIRTDQQRRLETAGYSVSVLIAYGSAWYPWYMRRLAERPANVVFALRQLLP